MARHPEDVSEYIRVCLAGTFYESLMTERQLAKGEGYRNRLKVRFYGVLFGENVTRKSWRSKLRRRFRETYPTVAKVLKELKARNYRHSSHLLQNYESTLFIYRIATHVMREHPGMFLATIHDCLVTVDDPKESRDAKAIIRMEFAKLGIEPTFKETKQ